MGLLDGYQPRIVDKWLHVAQDGYPAVERRYVGRFGMKPKIIVIHIQEGYNLGSWQHFHSVTASSTVLIGKNGDIWRLVPESDAPWTNGDVQGASAFAWKIMNTWGADPNVYTLSIETEGFTGDWPKSDAQLKSVVWQVYEWQKQYNIEDVYVIRHAEINSVSRRYCPGDAYYNYLIAELGKLDISPIQETKYGAASPVMVDGVKWDGTKDVIVNGVKFYSDPRTVTTDKRVNVHVYADSKSLFTRNTLEVGQDFNVLGWVRGENVDGEDRWWITKYFSRVWVGGTSDKPEDGADTLPEKLPGGALIVDGVVYYPAKQDGKNRKLTVIRKANLRKRASTKSSVLGAVAKGDELEAEYWCFGEGVNNENAWWVLTDPNGAIEHGARIWIAATNARPD